jgi:predicted amidohydrolase YtcJ
VSAPASLVLQGGPVFTGDGWTHAVAVRGGEVVATGEAARGWTGAGTRVVDLAGRCAVPGFHDAHTHLLGGALAEDALDLLEARCDDDLARAVAVRLAERGEAEWVVGRGWDSDLFPGGRWPARAPLDVAAPRTPVLLRRRDGHAALANAAALRRAGLTRETPDPPGGRFLRDAQGELTGIVLEDPALELLTRHVPTPGPEAQARAAARALARCARLGITSVQDDPSFDESLRPIETYAALHARGQLTARLLVWRRLERPLEALEQDERALRATGVPLRALGFGLLKGYLDGSLGSRTALMDEPYHDDPCHAGMPVLDVATATARARVAHTGGRQVGLHAIGDLAVARALDAYEAIAREAGLASVRAARHRVEHAQVFRAGDVERLARLGVVASVQPIHVASDLRVAAARLGPERSTRAYPWRALMDAGALVACGTDFPVEPLDPLPNVACAVTRRSSRPRDRALPAFVPEQALTLDEALASYGVGSARAAHRESWLGRLAPGFAADIAVVSEDLTRVPVDAVASARVVMTIMDGRVVYEEPG